MTVKPHAYRPIAQMSRAEIIDELGPLDEWYDGVKPKVDRMEALREVIRGGGESKLVGWAERDRKNPAEPVQYDGAKYQVQLTACSAKSWIPSLSEVFEQVGSIRFLQECTLSLKSCRQLVPLADEKGYIRTDDTGGSRKIEAVVSIAAGVPRG